MDDFNKFLEKVLEKKNLEEKEAFEVFLQLSRDDHDSLFESQASAFLTALRVKGEILPEIVGAAKAMLKLAIPFPEVSGMLADIVGTGGDKKQTFNISTLAALTVAASGIPVAKHGNRAVSSLCGSADLLEALGIPVETPAEKAFRQLKSFSFAFLFARSYHPCFKKIAEVRKKLGFRTIFNLVGPITNPARPKAVLLGVFHSSWLEPMALALKELGCEKAWVVHGSAGTDELDLEGENSVVSLDAGKIKRILISPEEAGLKRTTLLSIQCKDRDENLKGSVRVLQGEPGPLQDVVSFNAGACLHLAGLCNLKEGVALAKKTMEDGKAWSLVERLQKE